MVDIHVSRDTTVAPERVRAAFTDFSDHRFDVFGNLDRRSFQVHTLGETSAEVTEGTTAGGGVWQRLRYDWSRDGVVRLEALDSNAFAVGSFWEYRIQTDRRGGSHVDLTVHSVPSSLKGRLLGPLLQASGRWVFGKDLARTLERIARDRA